MEVYIVTEIDDSSLNNNVSVVGVYLEEDLAYKSCLRKDSELHKKPLDVIKNYVTKHTMFTIEKHKLITNHHVPVGTYLSLKKQ